MNAASLVQLRPASNDLLKTPVATLPRPSARPALVLPLLAPGLIHHIRHSRHRHHLPPLRLRDLNVRVLQQQPVDRSSSIRAFS